MLSFINTERIEDKAILTTALYKHV